MWKFAISLCINMVIDSGKSTLFTYTHLLMNKTGKGKAHSTQVAIIPTSITALSTVIWITFTRRLPMCWDLTLPMDTFQTSAGVGRIVLSVAIHAHVTFYTLTCVSRGGGYAFTMEASWRKEEKERKLICVYHKLNKEHPEMEWNCRLIFMNGLIVSFDVLFCDIETALGSDGEKWCIKASDKCCTINVNTPKV